MKADFLIRAAVMATMVALATGAGAAEVDDLVLMTEEYPPYNYTEDGKPKGFAVDLLVRILEKAGSKLTREDIRVMPWSNAYNQALQKPNTVVFATSRTPSREDLFKWVGPMSVNRIALIAPKKRGLEIGSMEAAKRHAIGAIRDDSGENLLIQKGVEKEKIERLTNPLSMIRMMEAGRIDMAAYGDISMNWVLKSNGFDPDDYEVVLVLDEIPAFYAFNKETPDAVIQTLQNALDELKQVPEDGGKSEHRKILDQYLR